jgi:hypothetical protein
MINTKSNTWSFRAPPCTMLLSEWLKLCISLQNNEIVSRSVKCVELTDDYLIYLFYASFIPALRFSQIA